MRVFNSQNKIIFGIICVVMFGCILGYTFYEQKVPSKVSTQAKATISLDQTIIVAAIANTDPLREKGLGGVTSLNSNQGMFFMFDTSGLYGFWMKDMLIPIDMIWLDQNLKVVYIEPNVLPSTYPAVFTPTLPAMYVLETQSGFAEKNSIKIGDTAKILSITSK